MVERLRFNDFVQTVADKLSAKLGGNYIVSVNTINKNNGLSLKGICIRQIDSNTAPVIYLNDYYRDCVNGRAFDDVVADILTVYRGCDKNVAIVDEFNWDKIKDKVILRLVNYEMNQRMLHNMPHKIVMNDLTVTFQIMVDYTTEGLRSAVISNELFQRIGTTVDDMYEIALENTMKLFPASIRDMNEIILSMLNTGMEDMEDCQELKDLNIPTGEEPRMYVLSNNTGIYGAATLLYPGVLKEFVEKTGYDLFILPSSLHEIILVPVTSNDYRVEDLKSMVSEVNQNNVPREDILSNNVYRFSRKENRIEQL
jgi:hypothetical protein